MSKKKIKVSVIVPIFNGESFVRECCRQLADQTLDDVEIILVDDGSTDETGKICDEMAVKYSQCHVYHQENIGVSAARNLGISHAKGEYLGFVDVDDRFDKDMYEILYDCAAKNNLDLLSMDSCGDENALTILEEPKEILRLFLRSKIGISACSKIVRRSLFPEFNFPKGKKIYEDCEAVYSGLIHSKKVGILNVQKYHYIHHPVSNSRAVRFTEKYFDAIDIVDKICQEVDSNYPELKDDTLRRKAVTYLRIVKIYYLRGCPEEYTEKIRALKEWLSNIPRKKLFLCYSRNDLVRYILCLYMLPVFKVLIKLIDKQ